MASEPACLIVAYRRFEQIPNYIRQGLDSGFKNFYLAVDGGKNEKERASQLLAIEKLTQLPLPPNCKLFIWQRDRNLGLAPSMISAIDWFFQYEESGVILEDDLLLHEDFLNFCKANLVEFRDSVEIFSVSGNQFFPSITGGNFGNYPLIWGWATWRDRWLQIRNIYTAQNTPNIPFPGGRSVAGFWKAGLHRVEHGILSSWALPFASHSRLNGWVHLYPSVNLVRNIGDDEYAEHTSALSEIALRPFSKLELSRTVPNASESDIDFINRELESKFFLIKRRHLLSPMIAKVQTIFNFRHKSVNLQNQLGKVELPSNRSV